MDVHLTLVELLRTRAAQSGASPGWLYREAGGPWQSMGWAQCWSTVQKLAQALQNTGLSKGERLGILLPNSLEWELAHFAAMAMGAVVVGMDMNDTPSRLQQIAAEAGLSGLLVSDGSVLQRLDMAQLPACRFVVSVAPVAVPAGAAAYSLVPWQALLQMPESPQSQPMAGPGPSDPATLIYTSGTTGDPKGILYTHAQVSQACLAIVEAFAQIGPGSRFLCWMPLSNLFQRMMNLCAVAVGGAVYLLRNPLHVLKTAHEVSPHVFIGVPRLYEKLWSAMQLHVAALPWWRRAATRAALAIGLRKAARLRGGVKVPVWLQVLHRCGDRLVLRKLRAVLGGDVLVLISGSAPMPYALLERFHAMGWLILEAYGLSENIMPMAMNTPFAFQLGSVGKPLVHNDIKVHNDGMIYVRGTGVFSGYWGDAARAGFTADGYYMTGDYGYFDNAGFLYLRGRTSDLIKISTGHRIAPAKIETALRSLDFVSHALVCGHGRRHLVALLTIDWNLVNSALEAPQPMTQTQAGESTPQQRAYIAAGIEAVRMRLLPYERPAGFLIFYDDFSVGGGELTSNLKLRREAVEQKYRLFIERLYETLEHDKTGKSAWGFYSSALNRMDHIAELPVLAGLPRSKLLRLGLLTRLLALMSAWLLPIRFLRYLIRRVVHERYQAWAIQRTAEILGRHLGNMKGPVLKLGQMAGYMADGLPAPIRMALIRLLDTSAPLDGALIRKLVEKEFGRPMSALFSQWSDVPLAAASMGQVHLARLHNGRRVVVKVRYPDIRRVVEGDFKMVRALLPLLARLLGVANLREVFAEFETLMLAECDFRKEVRNQQAFRRIFADKPYIIIPEVFPEYCTAAVMTSEYVEGESFERFCKVATQEQKNRAGEIIWEMGAISINRYAAFNADPHAGNYLFVDDKVCFVDFGFVKSWSPRFVDLWKQKTLAGLENDLERFSALARELGFVGDEKRYDFEAMLNQEFKIYYLPYLEDCSFRFTREVYKRQMDAMVVNNPNLAARRLPVEFAAITRLTAAQFAVLAELGAQANWRRILLPLLCEPTLAILPELADE